MDGQTENLLGSFSNTCTESFRALGQRVFELEHGNKNLQSSNGDNSTIDRQTKPIFG